MFGCCKNSQKKYIDSNGDIDLKRLEVILNIRNRDELKERAKTICKCSCHQDGKIMMC